MGTNWNQKHSGYASQNSPLFMEVGNEQIAYRIDQADVARHAEFAVVWLSGLASDMTGKKADCVAQWCREHGHKCVRMDYSGHGESSGDYADGYLSLWLEQAKAIIKAHTADARKVILCGSSMGGWLAFLLAHRWKQMSEVGSMPELTGTVLVAPAFDLTELCMRPELSEANLAELRENGRTFLSSDYADEDDYLLTKQLLDDGDTLNFGQQSADIDCPVRIVQGNLDTIVRVETALACLNQCGSDDARMTVMRGGDHRLSRPEDIAVLLSSISDLVDLANPVGAQ